MSSSIVRSNFEYREEPKFENISTTPESTAELVIFLKRNVNKKWVNFLDFFLRKGAIGL